MFLNSSIKALITLLTVTAHSIVLSDAESSLVTLQQWYNESIGLWIPSTGTQFVASRLFQLLTDPRVVE